MLEAARYFYLFFGLVTLIGGVQAFISIGSKPSLIAGGVSGLLLLLAGWLAFGVRPLSGLVLGLVICLALAGRFLPKFFKERSWWPAGVEGFLGLAGLLLSVLALLGK